MSNRPSEKDQVRMVMKNILPTYGHQLAPILRRLLLICMMLVYKLRMLLIVDLLRRVVQNLKRSLGVGNSSNSGNNGGKTSEVHVVNVRREFTPLGMTLSQALEALSTKGFIKPLDLGRYTPNTSNPNYNASEYCKYQQSHGHFTNPLPDYHTVPPPTWC